MSQSDENQFTITRVIYIFSARNFPPHARERERERERARERERFLTGSSVEAAAESGAGVCSAGCAGARVQTAVLSGAGEQAAKTGLRVVAAEVHPYAAFSELQEG